MVGHGEPRYLGFVVDHGEPRYLGFIVDHGEPRYLGFLVDHSEPRYAGFLVDHGQLWNQGIVVDHGQLWGNGWMCGPFNALKTWYSDGWPWLFHSHFMVKHVFQPWFWHGLNMVNHVSTVVTMSGECCIIKVSPRLIVMDSFFLLFENRILLVFSWPKWMLSLLSSNQSQRELKSLFNCFSMLRTFLSL